MAFRIQAEFIMDEIRDFLLAICEGRFQAELYAPAALTVIAVAMYASFFICEGVLRVVARIVAWTSTDWDDDLLNARFMKALSQLAPAIALDTLLPVFFVKFSGILGLLKLATSLYILVTVVYILCILVTNLYEAMRRRRRTSFYAIKGVFDMTKIVIIGAGFIIGVSLVWGKSPSAILTALGASAAVLMLVFKDTLLGLVAGIQLTMNHMLKPGDWIITDKHDINGEVIEVSLTAVKVRNWDNSVSTIPPYVLLTDSFKNYQPMRQSGGRRVERSVFIDVNTIRFLDHSELDRLQQRGLLGSGDVTHDLHVVNLSLLRTYLEQWLENHPDVNRKMIIMVRQMQPTQSGLPLQLYFFVSNTQWKDFERIQSEIFDHVYAVVNEFGLRLFQSPTGTINISNN